MAKRRSTEWREWIVIFLITGLVMSLYYSGQFDQRSENIKNCEVTNEGFREVNHRTPKFNRLFKAERKEPEHKQARLAPVQNVTLADCEEAFERPWPF